MKIGTKTSYNMLVYLVTWGNPREKKEAKVELSSRAGDNNEKGGEDMAKKTVAEPKTQPTKAEAKAERRHEVFKVRSKGDLGVPSRVAQEAGIIAGSKFTCKATGNAGEILVQLAQ
jgi:hypothetical protein